jgi:hypothetical protein
MAPASEPPEPPPREPAAPASARGPVQQAPAPSAPPAAVPAPAPPPPDPAPSDEPLLPGRRVHPDPGRCEICGFPLCLERHCKIICPNCGYTRDCSDP